MIRPDRPVGRGRRSCRPGLERLDARELPSASPGAVLVPNVPTQAPSFYPPATPTKQVFHAPLIPDGGVVALDSFAQIIQTSYPQKPTLNYMQGSMQNSALPSITIQPYTPSTAELEREHFIAKYSGRYMIGPGRFSDEAYTIHALTRTGGSNQYTRGLAQLFLVEPKVATAANPNSLVQGLGSNFPYNTLSSGSNLITDFTGDTASGKQFGNYVLPTHLTWYQDTTSSGGYSTPFNFTEGAGVIDIAWYPDKTPRPGTLGTGRVVWLYQGLVNTSGILNSLEPRLSS